MRYVSMVRDVIPNVLAAASRAAAVLYGLDRQHLPVENKGHSRMPLLIAALSSTFDRKEVVV